ERAAFLGVSIEHLDEAAAKRLLGPFYVVGFEHFFVPDTIFDEQAVMESLARYAQVRGVRFHTGKAKLGTDSNGEFNYAVDVAGTTVQADNVVLCAGAGLIPLLESVGLEHPLTVFQSPLLVVPSTQVVGVPLLVDISKNRPTSGLSVVQHPSSQK